MTVRALVAGSIGTILMTWGCLTTGVVVGANADPNAPASPSYWEGYNDMQELAPALGITAPNADLFGTCSRMLQSAAANKSVPSGQDYLAGCVDSARHFLGYPDPPRR